MTDSPELARAHKRIEELERMLDTFHAVNPEAHPSARELERARRRAAEAEEAKRAAEYETYMRAKMMAETRADRRYRAIDHIDGDPTNNDLSNVRLVPIDANEWML